LALFFFFIIILPGLYGRTAGFAGAGLLTCGFAGGAVVFGGATVWAFTGGAALFLFVAAAVGGWMRLEFVLSFLSGFIVGVVRIVLADFL